MKDLFSDDSKQYQRARPDYSPAIVETILKYVNRRELAWDCGAGSGQFTQRLAPHFQQILATDLSVAQLAEAPHLANVHYEAAQAAECPLPSQSVDLVTVAQAIHWFDFDSFYTEVKRVLKANGVIAVIGYGLIQAEQTELNELLQQLYFETLKGYWDAERRYIDESYQTIPFPFHEYTTPTLSLDYAWPAQQILNYLQTWSGLKHYQKLHPEQQPLAALLDFFQQQNKQQYQLHFPVLLRIGSVSQQ